ncbi:hypothetical protein [Microvirga massiliensis]|uniref:hypothetical protein n=1 Tax=Microvirga massiliensis TaxID=1033741 RepID=UPI00164CF12C|nr:hypothetical protein [Microvirga massiliensis]
MNDRLLDQVVGLRRLLGDELKISVGVGLEVAVDLIGRRLGSTAQISQELELALLGLLYNYPAIGRSALEPVTSGSCSYQNISTR